ncbi:hypothetical protein DL769_000782 [Monosporascus sp. CRB-8-3]|nr:hypothetical protein DL769_000782 [Monosporascus sp. CRB-8-3]
MSPSPFTISDVQRLLSRLQLSSSDDASPHAEETLSKFTNPTKILSLPALSSSPLPTPFSPSPSSSPRLLVIGDVHGQLRSLQSLLAEAGYSRERGDRVVLTGDMINKGADSPGVVALAMADGFASVRGNHEDSVLRLFALAEAVRAERGGDEGLRDWEEALPKGDRAALATARSLSPEQRAWVAELPVILRVGTVIPGSPSDGGGGQELLVVHAGLVPGLPLEDQDPWAVMNMRTLLFPDGKKNGKLSAEDRTVFEESVRKKLKDQNPSAKPTDEEFAAEAQCTLDRYAVAPQRTTDKDKDTTPVSIPVDTREGRSWAEVWNEAQQRRRHRDGAKSMATIVAYGHDARRGLNIKEFTFGLDSGCVNGGRLTAVVFEPDDETRGVRPRLVSVACDAAEGPGKNKKEKKEKKDKEKGKGGKKEDKD